MTRINVLKIYCYSGQPDCGHPTRLLVPVQPRLQDAGDRQLVWRLQALEPARLSRGKYVCTNVQFVVCTFLLKINFLYQKKTMHKMFTSNCIFRCVSISITVHFSRFLFLSHNYVCQHVYWSCCVLKFKTKMGTKEPRL